MTLPIRSQSHRIDTKAINHIRTTLEPDFLVRNQEERDYGVDLHIERCASNTLTGDVFYAQVKGTEELFEEDVTLKGFPVKTIAYACLFAIPFFIFYTSTSSKTTKFLWVQKYVEFHLNRQNRRFREQESVSIKFPRENTLENNVEKIVAIVQEEKLIKVAHAFLMPYRRLLFACDQLPENVSVQASLCMHEIVKIFDSGALSAREVYNKPPFKFDVKATIAHLQAIQAKNSYTDEDRENLSRLLFPLKFVEQGLLSTDKVEVAGLLFGQTPY